MSGNFFANKFFFLTELYPQIVVCRLAAINSCCLELLE